MKGHRMDALHPIDWEILNATADDGENLEQIYLAVCYEFLPGGSGERHSYRRVKDAVLLQEVADRIRGLVEKDLLAVVMDEEGRPSPDLGDLSYVWRAWFAMTPEGRRLWAASGPGTLVERK